MYKMSQLLLIFFFVYCNAAFGYSELPNGLTYESSYSNQGVTDFKAYDFKLKELGYEKLEVAGSYFPVLKVDWLDRLYQNKKTGSFILIKANLKLSKKVYNGALYQSGDDFFIHLDAKKMNSVTSYFSLGSKIKKLLKFHHPVNPFNMDI